MMNISEEMLKVISLIHEKTQKGLLFRGNWDDIYTIHDILSHNVENFGDGRGVIDKLRKRKFIKSKLSQRHNIMSLHYILTAKGIAILRERYIDEILFEK